ncbi:MAG: type 4a pilus biogenesis protein PilO [Planctomycetota bacterium]
MMLPALVRQPPWAVWLGGATLASAMTLLAYAGLVQPNRASELEADTVLAEAAARRAEVQRLETRLAAVTGALDTKSEALRRLPLELGDRSELNRRIARLIELAQSSGLEVLGLQPGEPLPARQYTRVPLGLEATASFAEHLAFLERLHTAFPDIRVVGLELDGEPRDAAPRPRARIALMWFTELDDGSVADAGR